MTRLQTFLLALWALVQFSSCSKDENNGGNANNDDFLRSFNSQLCSNVAGPSAAYWDISHGLPVALPEIPLIANPGQQFVHSSFPLLGFTIPQGFTAVEVTEPQTGTIGVNVIKNDNSVVYRWVPNSQLSGQVDINAIIGSEINAMFNHYDFSGTPEVVCTTTSNTNFEGLPITFGARLLRFGTMTGQVWARSTFAAGGTFYSVSVSVAPSTEFENQIENTFLPISWQLLVGPERLQDSDLDGTPDTQDNFPLDPTRQ